MKKYFIVALSLLTALLVSGCSGEQTPAPQTNEGQTADAPTLAKYEYTSEIIEIDNPGEAVLYTQEGIYLSRFEENPEGVPVQKISFLNFRDKSRVLSMSGFELKPEIGENNEYIYSYYHDFAETSDGNIALLKNVTTTFSVNAEAELLSDEWLAGAVVQSRDYIVITDKDGKVISENEIAEKTEALPPELIEGEESEIEIVPASNTYSRLVCLQNGSFVTISSENRLVNFAKDGGILGDIETKGYPDRLFYPEKGKPSVTLTKDDITELWTLDGTEFAVDRVYRIPDDCCCVFPGDKENNILYCTTSPQGLLGFSDGDGYSSVAIRFSEIGIDTKSFSVRTDDSGVLGSDIYLTATGENPKSLYIIRIYRHKIQ